MLNIFFEKLMVHEEFEPECVGLTTMRRLKANVDLTSNQLFQRHSALEVSFVNSASFRRVGVYQNLPSAIFIL